MAEGVGRGGSFIAVAVEAAAALESVAVGGGQGLYYWGHHCIWKHTGSGLHGGGSGSFWGRFCRRFDYCQADSGAGVLRLQLLRVTHAGEQCEVLVVRPLLSVVLSSELSYRLFGHQPIADVHVRRPQLLRAVCEHATNVVRTGSHAGI